MFWCGYISANVQCGISLKVCLPLATCPSIVCCSSEMVSMLFQVEATEVVLRERRQSELRMFAHDTEFTACSWVLACSYSALLSGVAMMRMKTYGDRHAYVVLLFPQHWENEVIGMTSVYRHLYFDNLVKYCFRILFSSPPSGQKWFVQLIVRRAHRAH